MKSEEFSQLGLVGHWKFNEGIGSIAKDSSPEGNDGTIHGATWINDKERRMGLVFDGLDDYVDCGNDESLSPTDEITVEAWVKVDVTGQDSGIVGHNYWSDYICGIRLTDSFLLVIYDTSDTSHLANSGVFPVVGRWYHVVGTYDPSIATNNMKIYVDGVFKGYGTSADVHAPVENFYIGATRYDCKSFNGSIDEVRIYNRALSASEILAHYSRKKNLMDVQNGR